MQETRLSEFWRLNPDVRQATLQPLSSITQGTMALQESGTPENWSCQVMAFDLTGLGILSQQKLHQVSQINSEYPPPKSPQLNTVCKLQ